MNAADISLLSRLLEALPYRRFVSGEELAAKLGTHRQKIAELVSELSAVLGVDIFAVRGRGYKRVTRLDLFAVEKMALLLVPEDGDGEVLAAPVVDSTNDAIRRAPFSEGLSWRVMVADFQLQGRGRLGRQWLSGLAKNLLWSCRFRFPAAPQVLSVLPLAAGLAVIDAIEAELGMDVPDLQLKWPNDVYWGGKKLAGVLCESRFDGDAADVVVGIGVNIFAGDRGIEVGGVDAVSLQDMLADHGWNRESLAARLLRSLRWRTEQVSTDEGYRSVARDWRRRDYLNGRRVVFSKGDRNVSGNACGLADDGSLLVETVDGVERVLFGDVLAAVYG